MIKPDIPTNESERLQRLKSLSLLDTLAEEEFDDVALIAAQICETPIALISLVDQDRQWFKSRVGLEAAETHRDLSFCAHAINTPESLFEVNDATGDERFHDNPLVTDGPQVVFYAGVPLVTNDGYALGTLCVIDHQPKTLTDAQKEALQALSRQAMRMLELRSTKTQNEALIGSLRVKNTALEQFATMAAHDLKSPVQGIHGLLNLFLASHSEVLTEEGHTLLTGIKTTSSKLADMIQQLLEEARSEALLAERKRMVQLDKFSESIKLAFAYALHSTIEFNYTIATVFVNEAALHQILVSLLNNAIKHNPGQSVYISVEVRPTAAGYEFTVADNGTGIPAHRREEVLQKISGSALRNTGNVGLSVMKQLVERQQGTIRVTDSPMGGAAFTFILPF